MRLRPYIPGNQTEAIVVTPAEAEQLKAAAIEPDGKRLGELLSGNPDIIDALQKRYVALPGKPAYPYGLPVIVEEANDGNPATQGPPLHPTS